MKKNFAAAIAGLGMLSISAFALAAVSPVVVETSVGTCEPTTVSAHVGSPTSVSNMYLVVDTDAGAEQFVNIPTDGSSVDLSVGPFFEDTTVYWHVFGGGERDFDIPLWNGYGGPTFNADVNAYATSVGSFSWVIAGTDDPNPFVTWNSFEVPACAPTTKDDCKKGGWEAYGFKNQGQCVASVVSQSENH